MAERQYRGRSGVKSGGRVEEIQFEVSAAVIGGYRVLAVAVTVAVAVLFVCVNRFPL